MIYISLEYSFKMIFMASFIYENEQKSDLESTADHGQEASGLAWYAARAAATDGVVAGRARCAWDERSVAGATHRNRCVGCGSNGRA